MAARDPGGVGGRAGERPAVSRRRRRGPVRRAGRRPRLGAHPAGRSGERRRPGRGHPGANLASGSRIAFTLREGSAVVGTTSFIFDPADPEGIEIGATRCRRRSGERDERRGEAAPDRNRVRAGRRAGFRSAPTNATPGRRQPSRSSGPTISGCGKTAHPPRRKRAPQLVLPAATAEIDCCLLAGVVKR